MDLDLELLRTFLAVLDHGGFTRAGARLNKAQSTISLHMRKLEEIVDQPLFRRDGRGVALTEQGEILRSYAEALIELNDQALMRLRRPHIAGSVRLGVPEDFATRHLPLALKRFAASHLAVRLEVRSALTAELMRDLGNGDLDLVLARREYQATEGKLLWREPLLWVGARGRLFAADPLPLVMFPHGCVYRPEVLRRMRSCKRRWEIVYTSTSLAGVHAAVLAGLGVTVLAESTVLPEFTVLGTVDGLPELPETEIALFLGAEPTDVVRYLGDYLTQSVHELAPAARSQPAKALMARESASHRDN